MTGRSPSTPHLSTLHLHRYRYGELSPEEREEAERHVEQCDRCRERLHVQEATRRAFVLSPVPERLRRAQRPPARRYWWGIVPALAALAVLMFLLPQAPWNVESPGEGRTTRIKGNVAALEVVAERDGRNVVLAPGSVVIPGDRLQMRFNPGPYPYAAFAGRDGTGLVQVYRIMEVEPGGMRSTPFALELDETPGYQELFAIFSYEPPDAVWIVEALEEGAALEDAVVTSIRLRKEVIR